MRYDLTLEVSGKNLDSLFDIIASEDNDFSSKAKIKIKRKKDSVDITITSEDSSALRAVLNSITTNITIFEKTCSLKGKNG
jgi:tRNA threonylcarbamoyladenosine modification (KEOPS) complex  Pcc1 subunit